MTYPTIVVDEVGAHYLLDENGDRVDPAIPATTWSDVRAIRDRLLSRSDVHILRALEAGEQPPPAWAAYRQALRDVPQQPDPNHITWPQEPSA